MRVSTFCVVTSMLSAFATGAAAQNVSAEVRARAERHMARGIELRSAGRDEDALAELRSSYRLVPDARAAAQLGLVHQALGQWVEADRLLRVALAATEHPWVRRNRTALEEALGVVDQRVGSLIVRSNVRGAEVRIDGAVVAQLPMSEPVRVAAGEPSIEVSAPGYTSVVRRLRVEGGGTVRETVDLREAAAGDANSAAPSSAGVRPAAATGGGDRGATLRAAGIAAISVGGAAGIAGLVMLAIRQGAAGSYNQNCTGPMDRTTPGCAGHLDTVAWAEPGMIAGFVVGGVGVAAGITMIVLGGTGGGSSSTPSQAFSCAPEMGLGGAAVRCGVRF